MALDQATKDTVVLAAKRVIDSRMSTFPEENATIRNAPFHSLFMQPFEEKISNTGSSNEFLIALSSWLHGLSTSLGQGFFESTAHALSKGKKASFQKPIIKSSQSLAIEDISAHLKNGTKEPNVTAENNKLFDYPGNDADVITSNFSADVIFERGNDIIAIELKSVRVNSGEAGGEKRKILRGKAHLKLLYPDKNIKFYIGFPFDPTGSSALDYDKDRYLSYLVEFSKYFDKEEILLGPELWDCLSGQTGTMAEILEIINSVTSSYQLS